MGHEMGYIAGPLALAAGIGATATGQPEIGIPLLTSGLGGTIGQAAGGSKGAGMGATAGGVAGLGADLIPGLGSEATSALGGLGSKISGMFGGAAPPVPPPGGQVPGGQLSPEMAQLANKNPSLTNTNMSGATVEGIMPGAPTQQQVAQGLSLTQGNTSPGKQISPMALMAMGLGPSVLNALGGGGQQLPSPPPMPQRQPPAGGGQMPMPQMQSPVPGPMGGQQRPQLSPQLLAALGLG